MNAQKPEKLTSLVDLRPRTPTDSEDLFLIFDEPLFRHLGLMRDPFANVQEFSRWIDGIPAQRRYELVATLEGRCIGLGCFYVQGEHFAHTGWLMMGVREGYRRCGVGGVILKALIGVAHDVYKLNKLSLTVIVENTPAICLYTRHGFRIEGIHPRFVKRNGTYQDGFTMALLLDPE